MGPFAFQGVEVSLGEQQGHVTLTAEASQLDCYLRRAAFEHTDVVQILEVAFYPVFR